MFALHISVRKLAGFSALFLGLIFSVSAEAHHSTAAFDYKKEMQISGTVKEFKWQNPHMFIDVLVQQGRKPPVVWAIECGSPNLNRRHGWRATDIKAGDKVTMAIHPMRDASPGGTLIQVKLPDGRILYGPGGDIVPVGPAGAAAPDAGAGRGAQ